VTTPELAPRQPDATETGSSPQENQPVTITTGPSANVPDVASSKQLEGTQGTSSRLPTMSTLFKRGQSRRELRRVDLRADAWLLADALASLSTLGLPQPSVEGGQVAVVSRRNRAVLEVFDSEEDARRALTAVTARRSTLRGRFAIVDRWHADRPEGAADEPGKLSGPPRPHVA